ncbi:hypothetical protein [Streptomyces sp. NPDC056672]|uniref:hypothetical protein n=1 Tax=Streptomyces sp. NPDC056672 TaxID=3345906 RepID=UPI00368445B8
MSTDRLVPDVDPRALDPKNFTTCDLARIELASRAMSISDQCAEIVHMLCDDTAVSGDYTARAQALTSSASLSLIRVAVAAERVRGSSWQTIGQALGISADEAEDQWAAAEDRWWRSRTPAQSCYVKTPGAYAASADRYATTGVTYKSGRTVRPLTLALDAASPRLAATLRPRTRPSSRTAAPAQAPDLDLALPARHGRRIALDVPKSRMPCC